MVYNGISRGISLRPLAEQSTVVRSQWHADGHSVSMRHSPAKRVRYSLLPVNGALDLYIGSEISMNVDCDLQKLLFSLCKIIAFAICFPQLFQSKIALFYAARTRLNALGTVSNSMSIFYSRAVLSATIFFFFLCALRAARNRKFAIKMNR